MAITKETTHQQYVYHIKKVKDMISTYRLNPELVNEDGLHRDEFEETMSSAVYLLQDLLKSEEGK